MIENVLAEHLLDLFHIGPSYLLLVYLFRLVLIHAVVDLASDLVDGNDNSDGNLDYHPNLLL